MNQYDEWSEQYPLACERIIKLYGMSMLGLYGMYLKRMRRYGDFPRWGELLPLFDLSTGNPIALYWFTLQDDERVTILCERPNDEFVRLERTVASSINAAWDIYKDEVYKSIVMYGESKDDAEEFIGETPAGTQRKTGHGQDRGHGKRAWYNKSEAGCNTHDR